MILLLSKLQKCVALTLLSMLSSFEVNGAKCYWPNYPQHICCDIIPDAQGHVDWPESEIDLPEYAFYKCDILKSIFIPATVTSLGKSAFHIASYVEVITFESGSNLNFVGKQAFSSSNSLQSIIIPSGVTSLGDSVFAYSADLEAITFESGSKLHTIGEWAFKDCKSLQTLNIPSGVTSLREYSFYLSGIEEVTLGPESELTRIGNNAFDRTDLHTIDIPEGVTHIGVDSFAETGCDDSSIFKAGNNVVDCEVVEICEDSDISHEGKDCAWVAKKPSPRCTLCSGNICAADLCRLTCDTC